MTHNKRKPLLGLFAVLGVAMAIGVAATSRPGADTVVPAAAGALHASSVPVTLPADQRSSLDHAEVGSISEPLADTTVHVEYDAPTSQRGGTAREKLEPAGTPDAMPQVTQAQHQQPLTAPPADPRLIPALLDMLAHARQQPPTASTGQLEEPRDNAIAIEPGDNSTPRPRASEALPLPPKSRITPLRTAEGDDKLQVYIANQDLREVLAMLSEQGSLNILPSKSVQGNVSASLNGVTIEQALDAILRSTGYMARREGQFIYVGTPSDFEAMAHVLDRVGTRIYRPNYVTSTELAALITPLLSPPPIGKIKATTPSKVDIGPDGNKAGANDFAGTDAMLVQDYESVLCAVDQIVAEIDLRPAQVAIEAMILSVRLNDSNTYGVDFQLLRDRQHVKLATGSPLQDLAQVTFDGGLKFAYLDSNFAAFLTALETVGDTNVIATPRLMVLNKQRAEILIGSQLGYVSTSQTETSTTQNVEFLEVGAQLRLRPFVANDGMIRMEIHPELSTGSVKIEGGFTLPDKEVTQVTTNIMVRDGYTLVIGGLMREDLITSSTQVPLLGSLPLIGALFRQKNEQTEKRELIVLVTPRIAHEPQAYQEGEQGAGEFHRRQSVYADKMSPVGKRYLGRKYFRLAQEAWSREDGRAALRLASLAVHLDPQNRAAIDLRSDIWAGTQAGDHSLPQPIAPRLDRHALDQVELSPFLLEQLGKPMQPHGVTASDPGQPGYSRRIEPPVKP